MLMPSRQILSVTGRGKTRCKTGRAKRCECRNDAKTKTHECIKQILRKNAAKEKYCNHRNEANILKTDKNKCERKTLHGPKTQTTARRKTAIYSLHKTEVQQATRGTNSLERRCPEDIWLTFRAENKKVCSSLCLF